MTTSYIGTTIATVAGIPTTEDVSDFAAVGSYIEIGLVQDISEVGDEAEDIAFDILKSGRRKHVNGVKDMGDITITYEYDISDAGQILLRTNKGTNTQMSFKITDPDGQVQYFYGVVASVRDMARNTSTHKGQTAILRPQSGPV